MFIQFFHFTFYIRNDESPRLGATAGDTRLGATAEDTRLGAAYAPPSYEQKPAYAPSYNYGGYAPAQCPQNLLVSCQPSVQPVPCSAYSAPPSYPQSYDPAPLYRMPNEEMNEEEEEEEGAEEDDLVGEPHEK